MFLKKPKIKRTHVTATDPETRKSVGITLYGVDSKEVIERLKSDADDGQASEPPRRRRPDSAVA